MDSLSTTKVRISIKEMEATVDCCICKDEQTDGVVYLIQLLDEDLAQLAHRTQPICIPCILNHPADTGLRMKEQVADMGFGILGD